MTAGYATSVKVSSDSTTLTNEACTAVVAGTKYQVTNAAKRVIDPTVALSVKDNGSTVSPGLYSIDPFFGTITFSGDTATGPVTVSGAAKNSVALVDGQEISLTCTADLQDRTVFSSGGWKQRQATTQDFSADVSALSNALTDQDGGAATQRIFDLWANRTPVLLEMGVPGDTNVFRAWCLIAEISEKSAPSSLEMMSIKLQLAPQQLNGRTELAGFGYGA